MPLVLSAPSRAASAALSISWPIDSALQNGNRASITVRSPGLAGVCFESAPNALSSAPGQEIKDRSCKDAESAAKKIPKTEPIQQEAL